jgi:desulfoferrodoxin (superoxide reductase-like protein)
MILLFFSIFASPPFVFANKAMVTIEAPVSVAKGSEVTIKIKVFHSANNIFHYVQWVNVMVNGKEIARWSYTRFNLPDQVGKAFDGSLIFFKEAKYIVNDKSEIQAEASCNIHGSMGPAISSISVKE